MEIAYLAAPFGGLWLFLCFSAGALALGLVGRRVRRRRFESAATGGDRFSFYRAQSKEKARPGMDALDLNVGQLFPLEIMFEIFSRLTVDSLLRCKCVCREWNVVIQHPKFIELHSIRSTEQISYYTSKDGATKVFKILDFCHGLVVERSKISGMCRVRNPATKQILALPDPKEKPLTMIIVFLASTNSYKLVCVYQINTAEILIGFKVLSFGGSDLSWRAVENSYKCELDRERKKISLTCKGGFIYFYVLYEDGSCDSQICCLDVGAEIVRSPITVHRSFLCLWKNADIERWDGKVALSHIVEEEFHVRVLEDPIKQKWAEKKIIPLTFLNENPDMTEGFVPYSASPEEVWLTKDYAGAIVYNTTSKQVSRSQLSAHPEIVKKGTCTLVKLKGMQPKRKQNVDECSAKFGCNQMIRLIQITLLMVQIWCLLCLVVKSYQSGW